MTEWAAKTERIDSGIRIRLMDGTVPLPVASYVKLLETDRAFGAWYSDLLAESDFEAFFWEHPPFRNANIGAAAEFVLLDASALAGLAPDPCPFRSHFEGAGVDEVVSFRSLGGDALLLAPSPSGPLYRHAHLATFVRNATMPQVHNLWCATGRAVRETMSDRRLWLSTSGLGVPWLHIRLDQYPKYYQHRPYATIR